MHDALQMAMTGHARLLDQYAELQEKHIILISKMREIRDGVDKVKTIAKMAGLSCAEERWFDVQAKQIVCMRAEQKQYKEEINGLRSQLRDTADAVQAAGELVVRLKDAEQAAVKAKDEKAAAEQKARALRKQLGVVQQDHVEELSTLQQCLREFGSQICSRCGASTAPEENDSQPEKARGAADENVKANKAVSESCCSTSNDTVSDSDSMVTVAVEIQKGSLYADKTSVLDTWSSGNDEYESHLEMDEEGGIEMRTISMKGYQYLQNEDCEDFECDIDDDEFLCESCGRPAKNGMRVCDWCFC